MKKLSTFLVILFLAFLTQSLLAQNEKYQRKVEKLEKQKTRITAQEKDALKIEISGINEQLERGVISPEKAQELKESVAKKRALNIENRIAIIENRISLLERNNGDVIAETMNDTLTEDQIRIGIDINGKPSEEFFFSTKNWKRELRYDRRTYSDFVIAIGLNNALIDDESLSDSPYKIGGSRFFEMGWQWRTRVFKNSNFVRLNYGFSFQFNGLKPVDNQFFVENGDQTELQEFLLELSKSKLRMDNLVFPVHFEFGSSRVRETEKTIRYNIDRSFRFGIGGYGGFNIGTRQKLKYQENGERIKDKFKRDYNTADLIYGVSAYAGFGGTQLYLKYDLNPIFRDAVVEQRNISLGFRFDL
ncbi:hypothetical protein [Croceitalea rosinachiae]|uniref:Outer membrane protein beta-barrel domain-containing protein n=1 Tax=Croceitalea rosinachiae TaxID=3075596 RepID=A0ABU3A6C4_9FLAO|nr:hypothetical protein [Croceitalea sp. F388]MDT0605519.1 hypothetical protein [Croceitalea sp. F388]